MPNTSVHFPAPLLANLDRIAGERGMSRNRVIVESCRRTVEERTQWPEDFFSNDHLTAEDRKLLQDGLEDFSRAIRAARRSRSGPPF